MISIYLITYFLKYVYFYVFVCFLDGLILVFRKFFIYFSKVFPDFKKRLKTAGVETHSYKILMLHVADSIRRCCIPSVYIFLGQQRIQLNHPAVFNLATLEQSEHVEPATR